MNLAIFDIDGTLTQTSAVDAECFARALVETHQLVATEEEWLHCPHISDTGITHHLFQSRYGRDALPHEEYALQRHFMQLLQTEHQSATARFAEVQGAVNMLNQLLEKDDWRIAVATGCWRVSAEMKLNAAHIELQNHPSGFAEDGPAREQIVMAAIERAKSHYPSANFQKMVSIGDGVWDVKTARNLNLPFVGIGDSVHGKALTAEGAHHIIPDFSDVPRFFSYLEKAMIPH